MSSTHTPGPWHVAGSASTGVDVESLEGITIAVPLRAAGAFLANAHLIAAAPELLAALLKLRRGDLHQRVRHLYDEAQAAIANATGSAA